jgi:hypothetical protein
MHLIRTLLSIYLTQVLLFIIFFLPSLIFIEDNLHYEGFFIIIIALIVTFVCVAFLRGFGPLGPIISTRPPFYNFVVNIALCSFVALNFIEFVRIVMAGTHQILYTESSARLELVPLKIFAFPAYYIAISRLMMTRKIPDEKLAILSMVSILLTGSRGLAIFGLISIILYRFGLVEIFRIRNIIGAIVMIFIFLLIGYVREPIQMDVASYFILVIGSLNQFAVSSLNVNQCAIEPIMVIQQFTSLFSGSIDANRVTYWLTECVSPGATSEGYGVASSVLAESMIVSPKNWVFVFLALMLINSLCVSLFMVSNHSLLRAIGCAWLPFVLYSVRAEIIYPYIFIIKILAAVMILSMLQLLIKASLKRSAFV